MPVFGLYGGADMGIPVDTVEQMRKAVKDAGKTAEIEGIDKSKQDLKNQLKKMQTQKDAGPN